MSSILFMVCFGHEFNHLPLGVTMHTQRLININSIAFYSSREDFLFSGFSLQKYKNNISGKQQIQEKSRSIFLP